ncbi:MAG: dehypoxanthine futalosine cyclase [Bacteroidales bacterium]|nr:dehypoxanthine futalosine cyclase [Bacteroidales bacterium]
MPNREIIDKILTGNYKLSIEEATHIYNNFSLPLLMYIANELRQKYNPGNKVGWIIDMNVNITNVCVVHCKFCNFCRTENKSDAYVLSIEEYSAKIEKLISLGGNQLLLQGGLHPKLSLDFYVQLFKTLKKYHPNIKLHALGPPEIVYLAEKEGISFKKTLKILIDAGLDSLPGAGAEILSDRVRKIISPAKANTENWLKVMEEAHKLNITTSATMMFGHIETIEERLQHLILLRDLQNEKPEYSKGFSTFIPWPFASKNTRLIKEYPNLKPASSSEYLRMIAISRIILNNIQHIQASWLTVGHDIGALSLRAGADDLGSIMIEENVVSAAGVNYKISPEQMQNIIKENGFIPVLRNQAYEYEE